MHTLAGSTAAVGGDHSAVPVFIEHNTQVIEPADRVRRFHNQPPQQLRPGSKVTASKGIQIVLYGRIVLLIGGLNAALGHHSIGIADTELGDDHNIGTGFVCLNGRRGTGTAAANDQHIHIIVDLIQVNIFPQKPAVAVQ